MNSDLKQVEHWRNNISKLPNEFLEVLDKGLPGWRSAPEPVQNHNIAIGIVNRCIERGYLLPKWTKTNHKSSEEQIRESHDYNILFTWSKNLDRLENNTLNYLDYHISGWRNMVNYFEIRKAMKIVERLSESGCLN